MAGFVAADNAAPAAGYNDVSEGLAF